MDSQYTSPPIKVKIGNTDRFTARIGASAIQGQQYGSSDYEDLSNKPRINNITLVGNISLTALGIEVLTNEEIMQLLL